MNNKNQTIIIANYKPEWPKLFEAEKSLILNAITPWVESIEHIGSTAVPNLAAKPVIDIMIGARSLAEADAYCIKRLEDLGYTYVPEYEQQMPDRRFFRKNNKENAATHRVHLVEVNSEFWDRHLLFRDYLRQHPEAAQEYEQLKRTLAEKFTDTNAYADAKTNFIKSIEAKAQKEKEL